MKTFFAFSVSILAWLSLCLSAQALPARIALIDNLHDDLEPLLVAELSKNSNIQLVERTEIETVLREHALSAAGDLKDQLAIATFLHADGLFILTKEALKEGEILNVRLTATGPGVVIGSAVFVLRKDELASLAHDIAARFEPLWGKLNVKREQALPISLLNLRCSEKSAAAEKLENQLTFLFGNRLLAQPELFILERWRLGDAAFEKSLAPMDEGAFWSGSYLVDGAIQTSGTNSGKITVKVFARSPAGEEVKTVEATGDAGNLPELATQLAEQLAREFKKHPSTTPWNPLEESREYLREADWACRNNFFRMARSALEASGALGNREPKWFRISANIYSNLAYRVENIGTGIALRISDKEADVSKEPDRLHCAQLALSSMKSLLSCPLEAKSDKNMPWWEVAKIRRGYVGNTVLLATSYVLRNAYEHHFLTEPALAEIRASIREVYQSLMAWEEPNKGWPGEYPSLVSALYFPYWYETPAEQVAACRSLLRWQPPENNASTLEKMRALLIRCHGIQGVGSQMFDGMPHLLSWNGTPAEDLNSEWRNFIATLIASSSRTERCDGMLLQIAEDQSQEASLKKALEAFWDSRDDLIAENRVGAVVGVMKVYLAEKSKTLPFDSDAIFDHAYCMKWLLYYLEYSNQEDYNLFQALWTPDTFTPQEAEAVYKAWLGYRTRLMQAHKLLRHFETFENKLLKRFPELHPPFPEGGLHVSQFHPIPEFINAKDYISSVHATLCGDKLWFCIPTQNQKKYPGGIYGITLPDFNISDHIELPDSTEGRYPATPPERFHASEAAFYYQTGRNIFRYDRKANTWSSIPLTGAGWTAFQPVGEGFYIGSSFNSNPDRSSGIWKWTASTRELQMISNNRRRPAQNRLDDCQGYIDTRLFLGPGGQIGARVNHFVYLLNAQTSQWEPVPGMEGCVTYPIATNENTLLLSNNGTVGLIDNRAGKPLEWYRGQPPANSKENSGILPSAYTYGIRHGSDRVECTVAYNNGKLWHCLPRGVSSTNYHMLRCIDWANPNSAAPAIPLTFDLPEDVQKFLDVSKSKLSPPNPPLDQLHLIATEKGLIFWAYNLPGFWYLPKEDIEKALKEKS